MLQHPLSHLNEDAITCYLFNILLFNIYIINIPCKFDVFAFFTTQLTQE